MKVSIYILITLLFLNSCSSNNDEYYKDDIYRVEVNTYLNIRSTPSKKGTIIGTIDNGALVSVENIYDGWAKLRQNGEEIGYVSADYLVLVKQYSKPNNDIENEEMSGERNDVALIPKEDTQNNVDANEGNYTASSGYKTSVYFIGDSTIFSEYDKYEIDNKLKILSDYVFIINTVQSVATEELFDYAPDVLDQLSDGLDSSMNWWQKVKSWFGGERPSSNIILLSFIKDSSLLQAECNGNSLKYLKMSMPEKYFMLQNEAIHNPTNALINMGIAIVEAGKEYQSRSWFIRSQITTGNIVDYICEDVIVENILPRDSFWHKWVFGWIFALPLKTANWLFALTGSYLITIIILMMLVLAFYFYGKNLMFKLYRKYTTDQIQQGNAGCSPIIHLFPIACNFYLWLSMLSMIIYMIPDMCNITVMTESGFSKAVITNAIHEFETSAVTKNWVLIIVFLVGLFGTLGGNQEFALFATLSSKRQKFIFEKNKDDIEQKFITSGQEFHKDALNNSETPFTDLFIESLFGEEFGKTFVPALILSFVFSGTLLLFASIFLWTKTLKKIIYVLIGISSFRKKGMYR